MRRGDQGERGKGKPTTCEGRHKAGQYRGKRVEIKPRAKNTEPCDCTRVTARPVGLVTNLGSMNSARLPSMSVTKGKATSNESDPTTGCARLTGRYPKKGSISSCVRQKRPVGSFPGLARCVGLYHHGQHRPGVGVQRASVVGERSQQERGAVIPTTREALEHAGRHRHEHVDLKTRIKARVKRRESAMHRIASRN